MKKILKRMLLAALMLCLSQATPAHAGSFTGTIFYTTFSGTPNVNSVAYTYDDSTHTFTLAAPTPIATVSGADGIIFAANGNLLVGGQGNPVVHELTTGGAFVADHSTAGSASFHLALSPDGSKVYTSNFGGPLVTVPLPSGVATVTGVTGGDTGLTQLAFAHGNVFYDNSQPNGGGNAGLINLSTNVTTRTVTGGQSVHGMIYDSFSDKIVFFGRGWVGSMSATDGTGFKEHSTGVGDFDQGAVDGQGHAFVAGANGITLIDYSKSGDITNPDFVKFIGGFNNIDDVAPLSGLGSNPTVPEPASLTLVGIGAASLAGYRLRRKQAAA